MFMKFYSPPALKAQLAYLYILEKTQFTILCNSNIWLIMLNKIVTDGVTDCGLEDIGLPREIPLYGDHLKTW